MINYIEIFEEERIVSKKVKNVISDKNDEESCIQEATIIMLFIGPYDLVNTCWPNIKYVIKKYFSRSNSLVDQITFPGIWTYPWKFLTSFSFIYYFFKIFFFKIDISKILLKKQNLFQKKLFFESRIVAKVPRFFSENLQSISNILYFLRRDLVN